MDTEDLENSISALTEKLHGVGLEIYHLSSAITNLSNSIEIIAAKLKENE